MQENQQPSLELRDCKKCGQRKPLEEFAKVYSLKNRGKNYRQHTCHECWKIAHAATMRKRRAINPESYRQAQRKHRANFLDRCQRQKRESDARRNQQVFAVYGGARCVCCGETEISMLTIDHINEDGSEHRNEINGGFGRHKSINIYVWLRKNNFPTGFQVLCYNCNISKHRNKGICAHQLKKGSTTIP